MAPMTAENSNNAFGDIKEKVRAFVLEYAADRGVTEVKDDEPILTNNIIDSLGSLRMIDFLETAFPLTIEDTDMLPENFQTLNACETFIKGKLGIDVNGSNGVPESMEVNGSENGVDDSNRIVAPALAGKD
jgi:acyl carrier protein